MATEFDFIIFGASGFTGQYVVEYLARALDRLKKEEGKELNFAVAGRNEDKLKRVLAAASATTELDLHDIPIVICDTSDERSLRKMAEKGRLVLNCVGPYRFYGEQVVKQCVEAGTHHLDISGEPAFLEKMQLVYDKGAKDNGIYVIGACGFDSIPSDLGHMYLKERMIGDVNDVEMYLKVTTPENVSGPCVNFGTWQSLIHGLSNDGELGPLRKQLFPERLPKVEPKLKFRGAYHYSDLVDSWCVPFPGSDTCVMKRTQRFLYDNNGKRPTQIAAYIQVPSLFYLFMMFIFFTILKIMAKFEYGRSLLESYPEIFSCGLVSKKGPSREMAAESNFTVSLYGRGWKTESMEHDSSPNRKVEVSVHGKNMGYGATCEFLVQSAIVVMTESEKIPGDGGVITPGYAFKDTSLLSRLQKNGIIVSTKICENC